MKNIDVASKHRKLSFEHSEREIKRSRRVARDAVNKVTAQ